MKTLDEIREIFKKCYLGPIIAKAEPNYVKKHIFIHIYDAYPWLYSCTHQSYKDKDENSIGLIGSYYEDDASADNNRIIYNVDFAKTKENLYKIPNTICFSGFVFGENFMIDICGFGIYTVDEKLPQEVLDAFCFNARENKIKYVYKTSYGYETKSLDVKAQDVDIKLNYNDNLPHVEMTDFINGDKGGIAILYGEAGTGKTSYIRHLIDKNPHKEFFWMDQSAFYEMNNADFIEFLCEMKDAIVVLEDCEVILKSREDGMNTVLSAILNLSDGILGDSLNIKFICTFNTNIQNLDKALLRKGRLKMQYEFRKLTTQKTQRLFDTLGIKGEACEMPLCEIYNFLEKNKVEEDKPKKIGF